MEARDHRLQLEQLQLATRRDDIEQITVGYPDAKVHSLTLIAKRGPWERGYKKLVPGCRDIKASVVKWTGQALLTAIEIYVIQKKQRNKQTKTKIPISIAFSIVQNQ